MDRTVCKADGDGDKMRVLYCVAEETSFKMHDFGGVPSRVTFGKDAMGNLTKVYLGVPTYFKGVPTLKMRTLVYTL